MNHGLSGLDYAVQQVLIGSILGDASITKASGSKDLKNYCFREEHTNAQFDYLDWKAGILEQFNPWLSKPALRNTSYGSKITRELKLATLPIFSSIRKMLYHPQPRGHWAKTWLPINGFIEHLDILGLLIWYLDDGSSGLGKAKTANPTISTIKWCNKDLQQTVTHLNKKYSLDMRLVCDGADIRLGASSRDILFPQWEELIKTYSIPECVTYKVKNELLLDDGGYFVSAQWTQKEKDLLKNHPKVSLEELEKLLPQRSPHRIRWMRNRLGLPPLPRKSRRIWTIEEINTLIANIDLPIDALAKRLDRTLEAIYKKRNEIAYKLFLSSNRSPPLLRQHMPDKAQKLNPQN